MVGLLDNKRNVPQADTEKLFNAGISYMQNGEYAFAFYCFDRMGKSDIYTLYNKALCCHCIAWFSECHTLLNEADKLLPSGTDHRLRELPGKFMHWEHERCTPLCPMPIGTPLQVTAIQMLILKVENAYRMHLFGEVRNIAARLGGRYKRIDELLKIIDDDNV